MFVKTIRISAVCLFMSVASAPTYSAGTDYGSTTTVSSSATLAQAAAKNRAGDYRGAITALKGITKKQPKNADAWNELGYAYRNVQDYFGAGNAYAKALRLNSKHRGALNYQGMMFLETGQISKAKSNAQTLKSICGSCKELRSLNKAISKN
ncbi:MAG: tetratricopeptide repeat protein [Alphaproteobacteria bacterium]